MPRKIKNFRDLGGIPAAGGKTVKKGLLYRSAHLCSPTALRCRVEEGALADSYDHSLLQGLEILVVNIFFFKNS